MKWRVVYGDGRLVEGDAEPKRESIFGTGGVACAVFEHPDYPVGHVLLVHGKDYYYWDRTNGLWCGSDNEGEMLRLSCRGVCVIESAPMLPTALFTDLIQKVRD